ncbi:hypothetical protein B0H17DRAFT_1186046 [Mycena rosella]|uniref:Protein kinase domain-containing protein n=1 Tax=Mycena rosella TaxID=1033263 RepID=A0AAD7G1C3_MYCRO|nr:hypothetical protein B0H17DRAFT_1186046 [Mycena rosella]
MDNHNALPRHAAIPRSIGPPGDLLARMRQFCDAVAFLQANCVTHMDIKLDNVVVGEAPEYHITLLDLGVACAWPSRAVVTTGPTGTSGEVAPEVQAWIDFDAMPTSHSADTKPSPESYDPYSADIWALGSMLRRSSFLSLKEKRPTIEEVVVQHQWLEDHWRSVKEQAGVQYELKFPVDTSLSAF